jgi:hypothetical protein
MSVEWRVHVPLSFRLFDLACRLALDSRNETAPAPSLPAGAVVIAVAAVEAFVNEEGDLSLERDAATASTVEAALETRELPDRWEAFVRAAWNVGFQRGQRPFQAFDRLHELRNAIVHYRPHFLLPGALPDTRRGRVLENLRNDYALRAAPTNAPWTHQYLSPECAAWACRTARDMVKAHFLLIAQPHRWSERYAVIWRLPLELEAAST